ncbi:Conserved_hypothetical protein [Hexamita inflata]|uniref:Leucine-rich repeat-containing protein n=1 Tax=Hexamita inflata TaxID=28002 RepID=A0ABP1HW09_9EUKA
MSVLMRRENTLIIEPGSDISKIQIINFILLPNSKKHFEGPPLYAKPISIKLLRSIFPQFTSTEQLIEHIQSVKNIDLSGNSLTSVDGLDMLSSLEICQLQDNQIYDMPQIVFDLMQNLRVLNLYNNQISTLPDFSRSHLLTELNIAFNPISQLDPNTLPPNLQVISVSGLDVHTVSIQMRFPNIQFVNSPEPVKVVQNEIEQKIHLDAVENTVKQKIEAEELSKPPVRVQTTKAKTLLKPAGVKEPVKGTKSKPTTPQLNNCFSKYAVEDQLS